MELTHTTLQEQRETLEQDVATKQKKLIELFAVLIIRTTDLFVPTATGIGCK